MSLFEDLVALESEIAPRRPPGRCPDWIDPKFNPGLPEPEIADFHQFFENLMISADASWFCGCPGVVLSV